MPASLESAVKRVEAALAAGLATPGQRNNYALGMVEYCVKLKVASALFLHADDPAEAVRSAFYHELNRWRRYPIEVADPVSRTSERRDYQLQDDGTLEPRLAGLIREHFDHYTKLPAVAGRPGLRPAYRDIQTGVRVPVFHHTESAIVGDWYRDAATCRNCGEDARQPCAVFLLLEPGEAELFGEDWQAAADRRVA